MGLSSNVTLRVVGGTRATLVFDEHDTAVVGRARDCRARLPDDDTAVSRHQFLLEINPPFARLRDLGSKHGTFVNGKKYGGRRPSERAEDVATRNFPQVDLHDGDEIRVGRTMLCVEITGSGESTMRVVCCSRCGAPVDPATKTGSKTGSNSGSDPAPDAPPLCVRCRSGVSGEGEEKPAYELLPGYDVVRRLGVGGMGAVYLARRERDSVWVALKVMLARVSVNEKARQRFVRESVLVEQLAHPNIVAFYERGSEDASFYFAMEFCPGGSVADCIRGRGGKLPVPEACAIALQSLEGLAYAHEKLILVDQPDGPPSQTRGVVHRDIKPANILLTGSERAWTAKLSDFGLAKCFETAGLAGCTVTGDAAGAIPYMPREQLLDFKHVLPVSDVWSMGATLFEMLTGSGPRDMSAGRDPLQVILGGKIIPIRDRDATLPPAIADVVDAALADDVSKRYPTAREFRDALALAMNVSGLRATTSYG